MKQESHLLLFPAALQEKTLLIGDSASLQLLTEGEITEGIIIAQPRRFQLFIPVVTKGFSNPAKKALKALRNWGAVEELSSLRTVGDFLLQPEHQAEVWLSAGTPVALWQPLSVQLAKPLKLGYLQFSMSKDLRTRLAELQHRLAMAALYLYSRLEPQLSATQLAIEIKHYLLLQTDGLAEGTVSLEFFTFEGEKSSLPAYYQTLSPQQWVTFQFKVTLKGITLYYGKTVFYGLSPRAADRAAYEASEAYFKNCFPKGGEEQSTARNALVLKSWNPLTHPTATGTEPSDEVRQLVMKDQRHGFLFSTLLEKSSETVRWKAWENCETSLLKVF